MIDAVLAAMLTPEQGRELFELAEAQSQPDLRGEFGKEFDRPDSWGRAEFEFDRRKGERRIKVASLRLADGVTYRSVNDRSVRVCGLGSDDMGTERVFFPAAIRVEGQTPPETILAALVGRHASAVIDHPALADSRLTITWAGLNGRVGEWDSFSVLVETAEVGLTMQPVARRRSRDKTGD